MGPVRGVAQPHRKEGATLRQDGGVDLGWALTHDHSPDTVFTTFFYDALSHNRRGPLKVVVEIGVRFLHHYEQGSFPSAFRQVPRPEQSIVEHTEEGPYDIVGHRRGNTGKVQDRNRFRAAQPTLHQVGKSALNFSVCGRVPITGSQEEVVSGYAQLRSQCL